MSRSAAARVTAPTNSSMANGRGDDAPADPDPRARRAWPERPDLHTDGPRDRDSDTYDASGRRDGLMGPGSQRLLGEVMDSGGSLKRSNPRSRRRAGVPA